jgi:hypothetical protein
MLHRRLRRQRRAYSPQLPLSPSATSRSARPHRAVTSCAAFGRRTWKAAALEGLTGSVALISTLADSTATKSHAPGIRVSLQRLWRLSRAAGPATRESRQNCKLRKCRGRRCQAAVCGPATARPPRTRLPPATASPRRAAKRLCALGFGRRQRSRLATSNENSVAAHARTRLRRPGQLHLAPYKRAARC